MFSDHIITLFGKAITITSHDQIMLAVSVVTGLIYWILLYFSRKRIVVVKRSAGTEQLAAELSRIASALERIANRPADRMISNALRRHQPAPPADGQESNHAVFSMFGR
jgi:hypothetical protein